MDEIVVMQRGEATMNVPIAKVQEYLDNGWREIRRYEAQFEKAETPSEANAAPEPKAQKPKGKGK